MTTRRKFLSNLSILASAACLPACQPLTRPLTVQTVCYVSAGRDGGGYAAYGLNSQQQVQWRCALPERAHAARMSPDGEHVIVMGRRPSNKAWLLVTETGAIQQQIITQSNRHFFGHGDFSQDGRYLYTTENNVETFAGVIGIRDLSQQGDWVGEIPSYGIGPHQLQRMPESADIGGASHPSSIIVVANGGIKTAAHARTKLNLDTMQPNLAYIDIKTGKLLQAVTPSHFQSSVRHLDIHSDGSVVVGMQFQGARDRLLPLVSIHRFGEARFTDVIMPIEDWSQFQQYVASVSVNSSLNQACVTSPRGNLAMILNLKDKTPIAQQRLSDCAGAVATQTGFMVSDGQGGIHQFASDSMQSSTIVQTYAHHTISWDNHLAG